MIKAPVVTMFQQKQVLVQGRRVPCRGFSDYLSRGKKVTRPEATQVGYIWAVGFNFTKVAQLSSRSVTVLTRALLHNGTSDVNSVVSCEICCCFSGVTNLNQKITMTQVRIFMECHFLSDWVVYYHDKFIKDDNHELRTTTEDRIQGSYGETINQRQGVLEG